MKLLTYTVRDWYQRYEGTIGEVKRMNFFSELAQNKILIAAASGWIIAQILKTIIHTLFTKNFDAERLVGGGGMPSSHSATVCALSTATALQYGPNSFEFAMTAIFALVVMYDAIGVRQESGKQAQVLNDMIEIFTHMGKKIDVEKQLKEFIGHTPLQVLCGAILGIITALVIV